MQTKAAVHGSFANKDDVPVVGRRPSGKVSNARHLVELRNCIRIRKMQVSHVPQPETSSRIPGWRPVLVVQLKVGFVRVDFKSVDFSVLPSQIRTRARTPGARSIAPPIIRSRT